MLYYTRTIHGYIDIYETYLQKYLCWREQRFSRRSPRAAYLIWSSAFRPLAVGYLSLSLL